MKILKKLKKLIRDHVLDIVIVVMFVVGLSVLLYPSVSSNLALQFND